MKKYGLVFALILFMSSVPSGADATNITTEGTIIENPLARAIADAWEARRLAAEAKIKKEDALAVLTWEQDAAMSDYYNPAIDTFGYYDPAIDLFDLIMFRHHNPAIEIEDTGLGHTAILIEIEEAEDCGDDPNCYGVGGGILFRIKKEKTGPRLAVYHENRNAFILDNSSVYFPPLDRKTVKKLIKHFMVNNKLGITVAGTTPILIYDKKVNFNRKDPLAVNLLAADIIISQIISAGSVWMDVFKLKDGFKPVKDQDRKTREVPNTVFWNKGFIERGNIISSTGRTIRPILVPTRRDKFAEERGMLVDYDRVESFLSEYEEHPYYGNMQHFISNLDYYKKEPAIKKMFDIAETIGFLGTYYYSAKNHQTQN